MYKGGVLEVMGKKNDVNIKNIGILHNREDCSGVLFIEFYDEASSIEAKKVLSSYNYCIE